MHSFNYLMIAVQCVRVSSNNVVEIGHSIINRRLVRVSRDTIGSLLSNLINIQTKLVLFTMSCLMKGCSRDWG